MLLNNTGDTNLRAIQNGILDLLYGREPSLPKPPVAEALNEALETGGAEAAIARYRNLKLMACVYFGTEIFCFSGSGCSR